jgi:predicted transcriptional regulator
MAEATFTFRVDDELKARFAEAARAQDRTGAQLLRDFMREYVTRQQSGVDHDAWFRGEVEEALREAGDPGAKRIAHEDVRTGWRDLSARFAARPGK